MCGFSGFIDFNKQHGENTLQIWNKVLHYRGRDASGIFFEEQDDFHMGLSHCRLAVIDPAERADQPFVSTCKNYYLVYNGTIYNHEELRTELEASGFEFRTRSDTEVLLNAYIRWGSAFSTKLRGVYACGIYDRNEQRLILQRDLVGTKPLVYSYEDGMFSFSSDLRIYPAQEPDPDALSLYFELGYIPAPYTIYPNIYKLEAGACLVFDLEQRHIRKTLREIPFKDHDTRDSYSQSKAKTESLLTRSFGHRMISDAKKGILLSAGYDSTLLAAISGRKHRTETFSLGFEDPAMDESRAAAAIAAELGLKHTTVIPGQESYLTDLGHITSIFDEPLADYGMLPQMAVSRLAAAHGIKVILSGDGADELFYGYRKHWQTQQYHRLLNRIPAPLRRLIAGLLPARKAKLKALLHDPSIENIHLQLSNFFTRHETSLLLNRQSPVTAASVLYRAERNAIYRADLRHYLTGDLLVCSDKIALFYGMENREPYLDTELIVYADQMPESYRMQEKKLKIILKEIVHSLVPKALMDRPKQGFSIPLKQWMSTTFREAILSSLSDERITGIAALNKKEALRLRDEFFVKGQHAPARKVWALFVFVEWYYGQARQDSAS
jgi:asparagine synthase (glutamine-hydrolysing)